MQDEDEISGLLWLNGKLTDYSRAKVSIEDRGFNFGDGVYEVIRVYESKPFALDRHLRRFERSAAGIELALPMPSAEIAELAKELTRKSGRADAEIYIQLTRGAARRNHLFPVDVAPTFLIGVRPGRKIDPELPHT
ncbi:MAG TPA: aminotransferase class IV, partial [Blastocatellia bacterium]